MQKVLDMISKSHFIKEKKPDKLNFTKTENLYSVKDIVKKMKRQATYWKKMCANHNIQPRACIQTHTEHLKFNCKKKITQFKMRQKIDTSPKRLH